MIFEKEIKKKDMKLTGKIVSMAKYQGRGYELQIGSSKLSLCGDARKLIEVDLYDGEEIKINKITIEFEK